MFVYKFDHAEDHIFENGHFPFLARFSLSQDDYQWASPISIHNDRLEIAYVEKGIAYYTLDMNTVVVKAGEMVIINPNTLHAVSSSASNPTRIWVLYAKDFKVKDLPENCLLKDRNFIVLSMKDHLEFIGTFLREIHFLYQKRGFAASKITNFALYMLMALLYDMQTDQELIVPDGCDDFMKEIMVYLNENYMHRLTLHSIAEHFHISPSHLSHKFKQYFSISPINYLIDRRLCEAKWKLISTDESLEAIAYSLGYNNVNHFKNAFTSKTGCAPSKYRELYCEQH